MKKIRSVLTASLLAAVVVRPLHAQIRYVDQYSGATAGDKIVACIGDPALTNGGTCDARNLSGAQSIPNKVTLHSGITLVLPPPTAANFTTSANPAFNVNNASDVTILNGQVTLSGVGASAVTYTGTVSNLRIEGMTVVGSGAVGDGQLGFWCGSGQTLSNIRILNNTISGVITGISMNADLGGSIKGFLISGNHLSNIVGTDSGQGYGIHHANGSGNSSDGRIVNNYIETAQRHSIYQAKGSGVTIMGNVVRDHRAGVAPTGQERPAIMISRSQNITVSGNVVENSLGGAFAVDTDTASYPVQNVVLANNIVRTTKDFYPITVGTSNPSQDSFPTDVTLIGNQIYQDAAVDNTFGGSLIQVFSGKRIQLVNNYLVLTKCPVERVIAYPDTRQSGRSGDRHLHG